MKLTFDNICKTLIFVLFIILISHFLTYCSDMIEGVDVNSKVSKEAARRADRKARKQDNILIQSPTPITRGSYNIQAFCDSNNPNPCDILNHVKYLKSMNYSEQKYDKIGLDNATAIGCVGDNRNCINKACKGKLEAQCVDITDNLYADLYNYHICKSNSFNSPQCDMNAYNTFMDNMKKRPTE